MFLHDLGPRKNSDNFSPDGNVCEGCGDFPGREGLLRGYYAQQTDPRPNTSAWQIPPIYEACPMASLSERMLRG